MATTRATASTVAPKVERTGTRVRPWPGSNAKCTPTVAATGNRLAAVVDDSGARRRGAPAVRPCRAHEAEDTEDGDQHAGAGAQNGGVDAEPTSGVDRTHRAQRRQRRQRDGDHHGEDGAGDDGNAHAEQALDRVDPGTRAQRAHDAAIVVASRERPRERLGRQHQARQGRDGAEGAEGDGLGLDREFDLARHRRGRVELVDVAARHQPDQVALDRGEVAIAVAKLDPVEHGGQLPRRRLARPSR